MPLPQYRHSPAPGPVGPAGIGFLAGFQRTGASGPSFALDLLLDGRTVSWEMVMIAEQGRDHAARMAALTRLADGVADDVGGLIDAADRAVRGARMVSDPDSPAAEQLDAAAGSLQRAMLIVRQLEMLSGRAESRLHRRRFDEAINDAMPLVHRLAGAGVTVEARIGDDPVEVLVPSGGIEQVMMQLAVNARDAMSGFGRLVVSSTVRNVALPEVHHFGVVDAGRWAVIEMTDQGPGVPADSIDMLFDPFFTTKPPGCGSGLGLPTVMSVARQCRGQVMVKSVAGRGSSFSVWFPAADEPPRSYTVVIADEDPWIRAAAGRSLRRSGHGILEASDCDGIAEVLGGVVGSAVDLLLVDSALPGLDREWLRGLVASHSPRTRVVFMAGDLPAGAGRSDGIVSKPVDVAGLIAMLAGG